MRSGYACQVCACQVCAGRRWLMFEAIRGGRSYLLCQEHQCERHHSASRPLKPLSEVLFLITLIYLLINLYKLFYLKDQTHFNTVFPLARTLKLHPLLRFLGSSVKIFETKKTAEISPTKSQYSQTLRYRR